MRTRHSVPFGNRGCPVTGKQSDERGWIDTGRTINYGPGRKVEQLLISFAAAHMLGKHVGMLERDEAGRILNENIQLKHRVEQLELEVQEQDAYLDGIEAMKQRGMVVQKRRGRPKAKPPTEQLEE